MKTPRLAAITFAFCFCLAAAVSAKMPAAKSAELTSSFGNAPFNEDQLKALNEVLAVSDAVVLPKPAATPTPVPAPKPSKLKPSPNKKQDGDSKSTEKRTIDVVDVNDKTSSLTVDVGTGSITNLKVPASQTDKVKALLASLNLNAKKGK